MKRLLTLTLLASMLTAQGCTDKDDPKPCKERKHIDEQRGPGLPRVKLHVNIGSLMVRDFH